MLQVTRVGHAKSATNDLFVLLADSISVHFRCGNRSPYVCTFERVSIGKKNLWKVHFSKLTWNSGAERNQFFAWRPTKPSKYSCSAQSSWLRYSFTIFLNLSISSSELILCDRSKSILYSFCRRAWSLREYIACFWI